MAVIKKQKISKTKKTAGAAKKKIVRKKKVVFKTADKPKRVRTPKRAIAPIPILSPVPAQTTPASSPVITKFEGERGFDFPGGYGDNKITALVRDPYWLYFYWEISLYKVDELRKQAGEEAFSCSRQTLRLYDTASWQYSDTDVGGAGNWYVRVPAPNRSYCGEIGFKLPDGRFLVAARSNIVTTPLDRMSDIIDEEWLIPDWEKIYGLSGGFGFGQGSEEMREMMKRRLETESSSGWVTSMGSPVRKMGERPFWLVANAELIVYGATEPSASLTLQGRKINLRPDGTFTLRYAFPDGGQTIPIEAVRDDGEERREIIINVERKTDE